MKFTGERFIPDLTGFIATQHYSRYLFVTNVLNLNNAEILDIACGEGFGSEILSRNSKFVYGIDISNEAIEHAMNEYNKPNIKFLQGSTSMIPLQDNSIDVAVSFETIEHILEQEEMIQNLKKVLKLNGILVISSPNRDYYETHFPGYKNEFHKKELTSKEFKELLNHFFKFTLFFTQNDFHGTFIFPEIGTERYLTSDIKDHSTKEIESRFNICFASDVEFKLEKKSLLLSDKFHIESLLQQHAEFERIHSTKKWKVYMFLKNLFKW